MLDEDGFQEKETSVQSFLQELRWILEDKKCCIIIPTREDKEYKYSNSFCLAELEFEQEDVKHELKKLTTQNYCKTIKDKNNKKFNEYYYVFGKIINKMLIYIKVKIQSRNNKQILCISFHFPEYTLNFPYKK